MNKYLIKSVLNQFLAQADEVLVDANVKAPELIDKGREFVRDLKVKVNKF